MSLGGSWRETARARWSGARAGVLVVPVLAMLGSGSSIHAAPVGPPVHPQPIIDGSVVPECAWPSVVALRGRVESSIRSLSLIHRPKAKCHGIESRSSVPLVQE
jgi:hypothetical protein